MSVKAMDLVYSRWLLNSEFRALMDEDPDSALAGYDLTFDERLRMARVLSRRVRRAKNNKVPPLTKRICNYTGPPAVGRGMKGLPFRAS